MVHNYRKCQFYHVHALGNRSLNDKQEGKEECSSPKIFPTSTHRHTHTDKRYTYTNSPVCDARQKHHQEKPTGKNLFLLVCRGFVFFLWLILIYMGETVKVVSIVVGTISTIVHYRKYSIYIRSRHYCILLE
jgi:hypothetical protein